VKAITVRQPWAWAIIYGAKDVENRAQTWSYRGPLAIHAGTTWSPQGEVDDRVWNALCRTWHADAWRCENVHDAPSARPDRFPFGVIIGVADLTDVHRAGEGCCDSPWADAEYHGKPSTHLVLADPQPIATPIPARGSLGLWMPPEHIERAVCEQLPSPRVPL
jgi:hypothetical protein